MNNIHNPSDTAKLIHHLIIKHYEKDSRDRFIRSSGHSCIDGNEKVNTLAKTASIKSLG